MSLGTAEEEPTAKEIHIPADIDWQMLDKSKFFILGAALFSGVSAALYPMVVLKTRQQVAQSRVSCIKTGVWIMRYEGIRGLYSGFGTSLTGTVPARALYMAALEVTKSRVGTTATRLGFPEHTAGALANAVAGLTAATAAQVVWTPVDVISQRLMAQGSGGGGGSRNSLNALPCKYVNGVDAFRKILKTDGVTGLYRGFGMSILTYAPSNAVWWASYSVAQRLVWSGMGWFLCKKEEESIENVATHLTSTGGLRPDGKTVMAVQGVSAAMAGGVTALITMPMDTIKAGGPDGKKIMLTSLSAMSAETTTFPIDLLKTRLQLHGESMQSVRPASAFRMAFQIARNDGVLGMYKGLSPAIFRHMFYTPTRIVGYEHLRNNFVQSSDHSLSFYEKALIGGFSGAIAQVIASPADFIKVRMQADGLIVSQGLQPRYTGLFDALNKIIRVEGFLGLWKGVSANVQRAFLVNMGELACYDHAKRFIIKNQICNDNIYAHTLSSIMSGLSATALSCPADVVKTRMMNQAAVENKIKYRNSYDCLVKTVRIEGFRALWKGFLPTWARLGPWQFVFWVSYEKFRQISGLQSF